MNSVVLDASALLAVIGRERGCEFVISRLNQSVISSVNYSEVIKKLAEKSGDVETARQHVASLMVRIEVFDAPQARKTAELGALHKEFGLSLADRACLALGAMLEREVLTADQRMAQAPCGVAVTMIRERH